VIRDCADDGGLSWLLMGHDRLNGDDLPLTHQFIALMLGVRPPGVTEALHALEATQIIPAERCNIVVPDRGKLEAVAGDSDGLPEAEYERLVGSLSQAELHMEPELLMGHTTAAAVRRAPLHNLPLEHYYSSLQ
jgi:Crp-like helix-turn-helix domain